MGHGKRQGGDMLGWGKMGRGWGRSMAGGGSEAGKRWEVAIEMSLQNGVAPLWDNFCHLGEGGKRLLLNYRQCSRYSSSHFDAMAVLELQAS